MKDNRPLREVPTRALYALHKGIEKQSGLISMDYRIEADGGCVVCALGAMGDTYAEALNECIRVGFRGRRAINFGSYATKAGDAVELLNVGCKGTPEERREYMLRHIVNELLAKGKSLPVAIPETAREPDPVCL